MKLSDHQPKRLSWTATTLYVATQTGTVLERSRSHPCRLDTWRALGQNCEDVIAEARRVCCVSVAMPHSAAELFLDVFYCSSCPFCLSRRFLQTVRHSVEFELISVHPAAPKSQAQNPPRSPSSLHVREHECAMLESWVSRLIRTRRVP